jgi:putative protein kinase ArgK-like GTPase of G3E family
LSWRIARIFGMPPIVKTVATENKGIEDLSKAIEILQRFSKTRRIEFERRKAIARWRLLELLAGKACWRKLLSKNGTSEKLESLALEVAEKKRDPYSAIEEIS